MIILKPLIKINKHCYQGIFVSALLCASFSCYAQYRNDMPEVAENHSNQKQVHNNPQYLNQSLLSQQYIQSGRPKVMVLLGREFGSSLSQWQADSRETISTMNRAYQGKSQAKDTRDSYRMTEKRQIITSNITPGMQNFYAGFSQYLQSASIGMVSYDSLLRKTQRLNELSGTIDRSTDFREVEADAIIENVDILIEIVDAGSETIMGQTVDKVHLKITRMDTYETVAEHTGVAQDYFSITESWVTNDSGYEKIQNISQHHAQIGQTKAHQLLPMALTQPFIKSQTKPSGTSVVPTQVLKKKRVLPPNK
ncbi:MAG: hypothetical protein AB8B80_04545 [Marinicellaceae bacterium]